MRQQTPLHRILLPNAEEIRIIVTGSRFWSRTILLYDTLESLTQGYKDVTIVHGKCDPALNGEFVPWEVAMHSDGVGYAGADYHAEKFALWRGFHVKHFPADWSLGRQAEPIRNWGMVRVGGDLCVGFPLKDSNGTKNCLKAAIDVGIPVLSIKGD